MAGTFDLKAILSAVDNLSPVLKHLQGVAKNTRKYLGDVGTSMNAVTSKIGLPLAAISAFAAGFGLVAIKNAVVSFTELGEAVQKGALKAGMSNAQFQRMKYVAEQAGLPIESLEMSMGKLNKNIGEAGSGKGDDLVQLLKALHIPLKGTNGQLRNAAELLPQLADAFTKNKDPIKQAAMGTALFGKAYQEMLPMLNEGSDGIETSLARFKKLKGIISDEDLKGAKDFGDQLNDLSTVTKGFQMVIAKELVPTLRPVVESFIQWAAANKKLISGEIKKMVQGLVQAIKQVDWAAFIQGVQGAAQWVGNVIDKVGGLKNALIALALIMNAQTIVAIFSLVGALARAGLAFAAMALQAYIASNATLLSMLRVAVVAIGVVGPIGAIGAAFAWVAGIAAGAGGVISGAMAMVGVAIRGVGAAMMANPLGIILALATAAYLIYQNWDTLKGWFTSFFSWLGDKFAWVVSLAKSIGGAVAGVFGGGGGPRAAEVAAVAALPVAPAVAAAGLPNAGPVTASPLGSGTFNLNAPPAASVNGKVDINFTNAPPGMRVEQAKSTSPRLAINPNVGYRTLGTDAAF